MPVRLPRSPRVRSQIGFVRLLTDARIVPGLGWTLSGKAYRPGATLDHLDAEIALEYCGAPAPTPGHRRQQCEDLWILWRWTGAAWEEIARCLTVGTDWQSCLRPVIDRLLRPPADDRLRVAITNIRASLAAELAQLTFQDQAQAVKVIEQDLLALDLELPEPMPIPPSSVRPSVRLAS